MTENVKKNAAYKFNTNLLKASSSQILNDAKKEWCVIYEEEREKQDGLCICQRKVKYVTYMYNVVTQYTIIVGTKCSKNFNMNKTKLANNILNNILKCNLTKGEYTNIDNIITYCKSIEEELLHYFLTEYENTIKKYSYYNNCNDDKQIDRIWIRFMEDYHNDLIKISSDMDELIQQYNLSYLVKLYKSIISKITIICEKIQTKCEVIKVQECQRKIEEEHQKQKMEEHQKMELLKQKQKIEERLNEIIKCKIDRTLRQERIRLKILKGKILQELKIVVYKKENKYLEEEMEICGCGIKRWSLCRCDNPTKSKSIKTKRKTDNLRVCCTCSKYKCKCK
jgi:hypothetical protein